MTLHIGSFILDWPNDDFNVNSRNDIKCAFKQYSVLLSWRIDVVDACPGFLKIICCEQNIFDLDV